MLVAAKEIKFMSLKDKNLRLDINWDYVSQGSVSALGA